MIFSKSNKIEFDQLNHQGKEFRKSEKERSTFLKRSRVNGLLVFTQITTQSNPLYFDLEMSFGFTILIRIRLLPLLKREIWLIPKILINSSLRSGWMMIISSWP